MTAIAQARQQVAEARGADQEALQALLEWRVAKVQYDEFVQAPPRRPTGDRPLSLTPAEWREFKPIEQRYKVAEAALMAASERLEATLEVRR